MSLNLSRKYRPQVFADIVGQNHIKTTLMSEVEKDQIAHAYLFCGPRGTGKTTTARILAKAINCTNRKNRESEPCNKCNSCDDINKERSLDMIEIDAASNTGVDNVRENIIENIRFSPQKNKFKVFIIDEVHMLSLSAFNALLKTLEEPPHYVVFILATTEVHKVPATIISRTQRFDFKRVELSELVKRLNKISTLEKIDVDREVLENIARYAGGCIRDAESLLAQVFALGEKKITSSEATLVLPHSDVSLAMELLQSLSQRNTQTAIELVNSLIEDGIEIKHFIDDLIELVRNMMLIKISGGLENLSRKLSPDLQIKAQELIKQFNIEDFYQLIKLFLKAKSELKTSLLIQLPLELAVISFTEKIEFKKESQVSQGKPNPKQSMSSNNSDSANSIPNPATKNSVAKSNNDLERKNIKNITLETIQKRWHEILQLAQEKNPSLFFVLKSAQPISLQENVLQLGFKYELHQQRMKNGKVKELLDDILRKILGSSLKIETVVKEDLEIKEYADNKKQGQGVNVVVDEVLKVFGGEVVD